MRFNLLIIGIFLLADTSFAQLKISEFNQIDSLQKKQPKISVVFIHTNWCKYCTLMQNTTFKNDNIIKILNDKFYFVSFDCEDKKTIVFNNHQFNYKTTGNGTGINELAEQLGTVKGKLSFPTLCFLNSKNEIIYQCNQFVNSVDLLNILNKLILNHKSP